MYSSTFDVAGTSSPKYLNLILFLSSASLATLLFLIFFPQINAINNESPILINLMFIPAMLVGFLYGLRITERAVKPSETRSPMKRSIVKIFLFFFGPSKAAGTARTDLAKQSALGGSTIWRHPLKRRARDSNPQPAKLASDFESDATLPETLGKGQVSDSCQ